MGFGMTMVDPIVTITNSRFYYDDGAEGVATGIATAGTDPVGLTPDRTYRLRLVVAETAGASNINTSFQWQYYHTQGTATWTNITTTSSVVKAVATTHWTDGTDTTQQVGSGTFVTPNLGFTEDGTSGGGSPDFSGSDETETELAFQIVGTDVSATDNIDFRVLISGAAPGGTPHIASVTVGAARTVTCTAEAISMTESASTVSKVIKRNVPCTTEVIQQKFGGFGTTVIDTTYCDGSDFITSTWTNGSNATDNNISTYSYRASNGGGRWNGTNISATGNEVVRVRGRCYLYTTDANGFDRIEFLSGSTTISYHSAWPMPTTSTTIDFPDNEIGDTTPQWSAWYDMNPNAILTGLTDTTVPFERAYLSELGLIAQGATSSTENRIYSIEFEWTTGANETGYMTTATDASATWTNEANAVDGSKATAATFTGAAGANDFTVDVLQVSVPSNASIEAGKDIYNVCVRVYVDAPVTVNTRMRFLDASNNVLVGQTTGYVPIVSDAGGARWTPWHALNVLEGDGSWTNTNCDDIKVEFINTSGSTGTLSIYKVEVAYLYEDFNPQGAIVTKDTNPNLTVTCSTEALSFTESAANVPIDRSIDALAHSELLAWVMPDATVSRKKTIVGKTAKPKQWKALPFSTWWLDGHTGIFGTHDAGTIGNMLDGDLVTKYDIASYQMPVIQGFETLGPQSSPTALPAGIKIRWYLSGTAGANTSAYGGWRPGLRSEYVGNYQDGMYNLGSITVPSSGEGWTEWQDMNLAYNIGGRSTSGYPYSWTDIQNSLAIGTSNIELGGTMYIHGVQVLVEESEPANFITGYVNASQGWETDKGAWANTANAWDGSESTFAGTVWGSAGTYVADYFNAAGNTLTQGAAEEEVRSVWFRAKLRGQYTASNERLSCIIYPYHPDYRDVSSDSVKFPMYGGKALVGYYAGYFAAPDDPDLAAMWDFAATNTSFWTPWYKIDFSSLHEDWAGFRQWKTWGEVQKMGFRLYRGPDPDRVSTLEIGKVEYLVLAEPPNTNRGGGKIKLDRGVNQNRGAGGDLTDMQFAGTPATVTTAAVNRTVTCTTEAVSMTESASTVNRARNKASTTEAVSMASTGNVNLGRGAIATPEALALAEAASTVNAGRGALGTTEVLSAASTGAVSADRGVIGAPETLSLTENAATVSFATNLVVTCTTEVLLATESPATSNTSRVTLGVTETLSLTESASIVDAARGVAGVTQALALAEQPGTANLARNKVSPTEAVTMAASAEVNLPEVVTGLTEAIAMTEAAADIKIDRGVVCATEAVALTETPGAVNGTRIAAGTVEITAFVESASAVNAERSVLATTETLAATSTGNVNKPLAVSGTTEAVSLTEGASAVDRQRGVNAGTEALSLTEAQATVVAGANLDVNCTTEAISLTESAATANRSRTVTSFTDQLVMSEAAATVQTTTNLDVTCTTEAISLTESAANVNGTRIAAGTVELTALVESAASLNVARGVTGITELVVLTEALSDTNFNRVVAGVAEALSLTEAAATVEFGSNAREVTCVTETLSVQDNNATANLERGVSSSTELLALSEQPSSVARHRTFVCTPEQLAVAEAAATLSISRGVLGIVEALALTESAASVFRGQNLDITALTAAALLTEAASTVTFPRRVDAGTEVLEFVESFALANFPKLISAVTAPITMTEARATIDKLPASVQPGSMVWVDPGVEGAIFIGNRVIQRYD